MAAGGDIRAFVGLNGDIGDPGTYVEVTDDVIECSFSRGRANPANQWGANEAHILLRDGTRKYDPLNTSGSYYPNIRPGPLVVIYVIAGGGAIIRRFRGVVRKWEPSYYAGDESGTVLVTCGDYASILNQPMRFFADDWLGAKIGKGPACLYAFSSDYVDTTSGIVQDLSGQGRDGAAYSNWSAPTAGATLLGTGTDSRIDLGSSSVVRMGVADSDPIENGNGWFFFIECTLDATAPYTFGGFDYWWVGSSGRNAAVTNTWQCWLRRDTTNGNTHLQLDLDVEDASTATYSMFLTNAASTYLTGQRRVYGFGIDGDQYTLFAAVPFNGSGTLNGTNTNRVASGTYGFPGAHDMVMFDGALDTWIGRRNASSADSTSMDVYRAGIVHAAANEEFCTGFAASYRDRGAFDLDGSDRLQTVVDLLEHPATFETIEFDTDYAIDPGAYIEFRTVLEFAQALVTMGRGRMFADHLGHLQIEDEDGTNTASGATWSDQGGVNPSWKAGAAVLNTSYDDTINDVQVRLASGYIAVEADAASTADIGVRARSYTLPFARESDADTYVADLVTRFKDPEVSVTLTIEPIVSAAHWDNLIDCDNMGDTVTWEQQALATGPVVTKLMELGGEFWAWSQDMQMWTVVVSLEPNRL